jgi:demethylspheroidene O-methyltransferase
MRPIADRLFGWRDRIAASGRFQRWAASFPLTRGIARRQSAEIFDLCAGFVYSQILAACVDLDLFERLAHGPQSARTLAPALDLTEAATERLLRAATALKLFRVGRDGRYGLALKGAALRGNPGAIAMIRHHRLLYADLADPVSLLRGERASTALQGFWPYARGGSHDAQSSDDYTRLMASSQSLVVDDALAAYDFSRHRVMLDVGGGNGTFLVSVGQRHPQLRLMLFDLPEVAEAARQRFVEAGMSDRAQTHGGDAATGPLPTGADLITLTRVLHDHDDDKALRILVAIRAALPHGGTLLIIEPMAGAPGAEAMGDAYFGFYLLAMGSGRPRRADEICDLLARAGFTEIEPIKTRRPLLTSAIKARVMTAQL